jgi:hypothetical protein
MSSDANWSLELLKIGAAFLSGVTGVVLGTPLVEMFKDHLQAWRGLEIQKKEIVENLEALFGTAQHVVQRVYASHVESGLTDDERALAVSALSHIDFKDVDAKVSKLSPLGSELYCDLLEIVLLMKAISSRAASSKVEDRDSVSANLDELTSRIHLVSVSVKRTYYRKLQINRNYVNSLTNDYSKQKLIVASESLKEGSDSWREMRGLIDDYATRSKELLQQIMARREKRRKDRSGDSPQERGS